MRLMLVGNPNSGKTTVFNHLTGNHQHIGNFPGITVEFKVGNYGEDEIVDLPGIYSLHPHSKEEQIAVQYLRKNPPDGIINCIDMTNLRRSLALTLALTELRIPMVIVANMLDECRPKPNLEELEHRLGIPVFSVRQQNRWAPAVLIRMMRGEIEKGYRPIPLCRGSTEDKFRWIDRHLSFPHVKTPRMEWSQKADRILLHPLWGTLSFLLMIAFIFDLTFHRIGPFLTQILLRAPQGLAEMASAIRPPLLCGIVTGAISGVGAVLSFLPSVMLLFFFLSILEDSGYMVRICYLAENIMSRLGLSGKSTVPLLIGFGCSVPAILSARTLENETHRRRTVRLIPFISCSAKLPVYGMLAAAIAPTHTFWIILFTYCAGIGAGLLTAALSPHKHLPLLMEKPPFRFPKFKNLWHRLWGQTADFIQKVFAILLPASVLVTVLQQFTPTLQFTANPSESLLAHLAGLPVPLFRPIGLGHWKMIAALMAGLFAKESILAVLAVVQPTMIDPLPFLAFIIFYPPCIAALSTLRRETDTAFAAKTFIFQMGIAYLAAFIAFRI